MPRWPDLHLLGQEISRHHTPAGNRAGKRRFAGGHAGRVEHLAAGPPPLPVQCFGFKRREAPLAGGDVQPAAGLQAVVDAGLLKQLLGPFAVEQIAPAGEPIAGRAVGAKRGWRKDPGGSPGGSCPPLLAGQHPHREAAAGELTGQREADDASANDAAVGHG